MTKNISICMLFILTGVSLFAQPFQFRGVERNGIYPDTDLLEEWPESGPELVNTIQDLGDGYSAPAITEEGLFIAGMYDSIGILKHFNHQGQLKWSYEYGKEFTFKYTGARGTPTIE